MNEDELIAEELLDCMAMTWAVRFEHCSGCPCEDDCAEGKLTELPEGTPCWEAKTKVLTIRPNAPQGEGWFSVEQKPQESGFYVVWTRNVGFARGVWSALHGRWMGGAWTQHITHWMPHLKPPKEEVP